MFIRCETCLFCRYLFVCDSWLEGKDNVVKLLATPMMDSDTTSLVKNNISNKLYDDHLWFSVANRKRKSRFSRLQRLCCCLSILFLTMVSNAMWYRIPPEETDGTQGEDAEDKNSDADDGIQIGPIRITVQELYTSIMSSLIVVPPVMIITLLFSRAATKPEKNKYAVTEENYNENNSNQSSSKDRNKPKRNMSGEWPYWCTYIAYSLVILSVIASGFFTILYAMEWGEETANAWLASFLLSFVQSVVIIQPLKVCI